MMVLLLIFDAPRRRRLAEACRSLSPAVTCIESSDDDGGALSERNEPIDLVVLDDALLKRHGAAKLVNWWRLAPDGAVLVLDPDPETDFERVKPALLKELN